jgi:hypothetical protein
MKHKIEEGAGKRKDEETAEKPVAHKLVKEPSPPCRTMSMGTEGRVEE